MRLDNGIPLTPKLLGYTHDSEGNLVINQDEAPTVKLAFYMYLYGYSTKQIADALTALGRKTYLGNINWTSGGIVQILRNERHCGDVYTRKTYTPNFRDHKSKKNTGQRPRSRYKNHHEAIVSRDDFIAVQRLLDNAKYGHRSFLPELRVIESGILKGFVIINPKWAGFKEDDYLKASHHAYKGDENPLLNESFSEVEVEVDAGDFDMRGFEVARAELFNTAGCPAVTFGDKIIKINSVCTKKFGKDNRVELLVNPITRKFAVRSQTGRTSIALSAQNMSGNHMCQKILQLPLFMKRCTRFSGGIQIIVIALSEPCTSKTKKLHIYSIPPIRKRF